MFRRFFSHLRTIANYGVMPELRDGLKKRIRLCNSLSLFAAFVMFASIPFDLFNAPVWMVFEDVVGGCIFLVFPLLSRRGYLTAPRILLLVAANVMVLTTITFLGRESGGSMIFIALCAMPFSLFDIEERHPLIGGVVLSIVCFVIAESDFLAQFMLSSENYSAEAYRIYSAVVTLAALLFTVIQTSTANARAERELRDIRQTTIHSAKLAALGEMSGNIAHEVNNPLAAILLRTQSLRRQLKSGTFTPESVTKKAEDIERTVHRIAKIIDALRTFARDGSGDPIQREPLHQIVGETVDLCAERFRQHGVALDVDPIPDDLCVLCRGIQVSQVLLNLISNSYDAVEGQERPWVRISAETLIDARETRIIVTDSGPGIPIQIQRRIMEPFFTTKGVGKGTGLGLSVSKGIAESQGGRLEYDPSAEHTRFVLTLASAEQGSQRPEFS